VPLLPVLLLPVLLRLLARRRISNGWSQIIWLK